MEQKNKIKLERKRRLSRVWKENNREWRRKYQRDWRNRNPGIDKKYDLKRLYGITIEDLDKLKKKQKKICPICRRRRNIELVIDHCHKTGKVRGLLCRNCNRVLGLFKDKVQQFKRAVTYLENGGI